MIGDQENMKKVLKAKPDELKNLESTIEMNDDYSPIDFEAHLLKFVVEAVRAKVMVLGRSC